MSSTLTALALCVVVMVQTRAFATAPPAQLPLTRHRDGLQKVQCMKRLMGSNRKIFYVDAARVCESTSLGRRGTGAVPALVATVTPPQR
jgi:hypothetical protein